MQHHSLGQRIKKVSSLFNREFDLSNSIAKMIHYTGGKLSMDQGNWIVDSAGEKFVCGNPSEVLETLCNIVLDDDTQPSASDDTGRTT